ncbi:MAG: GIY-YIG nuclease family protein [Ardenticatenales bacterium]|nr:GIY-YIG nuclease family protein [Ardenticatenales bacterium]
MGVCLLPAQAGAFRPSGTYLLSIELSQAVNVAFGRFQQGRVFVLAAGIYVYVGSALGQRGATTLPRRLLRHASRGVGPPHPIRGELTRAFAAMGLAHMAQPPRQPKRLHWHVDYLLEMPASSLTHIIAFGDNQRRESDLAHWLTGRADMRVIAAGIGARDLPGETHLWQLQAAPTWWQNTLLPYCQTLV